MRHDDLSALCVAGQTVQPWLAALPRLREHLRDFRYIHIAADASGKIWLLDDDGAVYTRDPNAPQRGAHTK